MLAAYRTKSNHTALECLHEDEETDADRRPQYRGKQHYKQRLRRHDTTPQQTNSARWPPPLERTDLTRAAGTSPLGADTYSGYSQTQNNAPPNCRIAPGLGGFFKDRLRRLQSAREISEIWFDFTNLIRRVQVVHYNPNPRPTPISPFPEKSNRADCDRFATVLPTSSLNGSDASSIASYLISKSGSCRSSWFLVS